MAWYLSVLGAKEIVMPSPSFLPGQSDLLSGRRPDKIARSVQEEDFSFSFI